MTRPGFAAAAAAGGVSLTAGAGDPLQHERIIAGAGPRSGLPVIVAVHSTVLGRAVGGCRLWRYADWRDGLEDALRLAEAMTFKCASAGVPLGGGKSVIPLAWDTELPADRRRDVMLDLGDVIESLDGSYGTGEDVGTTIDDMRALSERTQYVYCGESAEPTADGVCASIGVTLARTLGSREAARRRITVIGLGQVGGRVARRLATQGAELAVSDVDVAKRSLAQEIGATWLEPDEALAVPADVLVPAALGGMITSSLIPSLRCRAIVGPANNQLADDDVAEALHEHGILWAPDFIVNAGGLLYSSATAFYGCSNAEATARVNAIGATLAAIFDAAEAEATTPLTVARQIAADRLAAARRQ